MSSFAVTDVTLGAAEASYTVPSDVTRVILLSGDTLVNIRHEASGDDYPLAASTAMEFNSQSVQGMVIYYQGTNTKHLYILAFKDLG